VVGGGLGFLISSCPPPCRRLELFITHSVFVYFRSGMWLQSPFILVFDLDGWREITVYACCGLYRELLVRESFHIGDKFICFFK
jgi:hypothetical protein